MSGGQLGAGQIFVEFFAQHRACLFVIGKTKSHSRMWIGQSGEIHAITKPNRLCNGLLGREPPWFRKSEISEDLRSWGNQGE